MAKTWWLAAALSFGLTGCGNAEQQRLAMAVTQGDLVAIQASELSGSEVLNAAGETGLHLAVQQGNAEALQLLMATSHNLDRADAAGRTPLALALQSQVELVIPLLQNGADPYAGVAPHGTMALGLAHRDARIQSWFAQRRAQDEPRHQAALTALLAGDIDALEVLRTEGLQLDSTDLHGASWLHRTVQAQQAASLDWLLKQGADPTQTDHKDRVPLVLALSQSDNLKRDPLLKTFRRHPATLEAPNQQGQTPLMVAAELNDGAEALRWANWLLDSKVALSARDRGGQTALHLALENNHHQLAGRLLAKGAQVNPADRLGQTPLLAALAAHRLDDGLISKLIRQTQALDQQNYQGQTALALAVSRSRPDWVAQLLQRGANPAIGSRDLSLLHLAAQGLDPELGHAGSDWKNREVVAQLAGRGLALDAQTHDGFSPLMLAVQHRYPETAKQLLQLGADPNLISRYDVTALKRALELQQDDLALALLEQGADPNLAGSQQVTALHVLAQSSDLPAADTEQLISALVAAGADPNATTRPQRFTPLHLAVYGRNAVMVESLLVQGADPHQRDADGHSALALAQRQGNEALLALLQNAAIVAMQ
ncbi:ankyrin repeat domain-containing protein [Ferrimonas marina]|uniref:Ankyrin repeat n=1 Tax=Ferrimonas marina TaxID=299255 RepID=A0A1M5MXV5_9GAMM|nr:ankyrin repeat domain-containing protein [Ferrimonas marina]SHG82047.1 Ankyrin repeat [Ferrimonas marina]